MPKASVDVTRREILRRYLPWLAALLLVVGIASLELSQLHRALAGAYPVGDHAIFELNVRRALSGEQRVGPYSQGFYHPGPAYFYWLMPAYALFGQSTFALYAAAQALTLLFLIGSCAVIARWSSNLCAVLALAPLLVIQLAYLGEFPQFDYWPPYILFFGYALFLFVASGLLAGKASALAPLAVLGSFLVQTHVSYAPAVIVVGVVAVVHALLTRPGFLRGRARLNVVLALLLLAMIWALPVQAELLERPGNFTRLYRTFLQEPAAAANLGSIIDKLALEYTAPWQFVLFRDRFIFPDAPKHYTAARVIALIQLALLAIAWRKARARRDGFAEALCVVCAVSLLTAAFSLTRIHGVVAPHHTAWISIIGFASWVAIAAGCLVVDAPRWAAGPMPRFSFLISLWFASCLLWPIRIISAVHANPEIGVLTDSVARVIRAAEPGRIRISWNRTPRHGETPLDTFTWATAVMLQLEKNDLQFTTGRNPDLRWMLGKPRWESPGNAGTEVMFYIGLPPPPFERVECIERGENYFLRYPVCIGRLAAAAR